MNRFLTAICAAFLCLKLNTPIPVRCSSAKSNSWNILSQYFLKGRAASAGANASADDASGWEYDVPLNMPEVGHENLGLNQDSDTSEINSYDWVEASDQEEVEEIEEEEIDPLADLLSLDSDLRSLLSLFSLSRNLALQKASCSACKVHSLDAIEKLLSAAAKVRAAPTTGDAYLVLFSFSDVAQQLVHNEYFELLHLLGRDQIKEPMQQFRLFADALADRIEKKQFESALAYFAASEHVLDFLKLIKEVQNNGKSIEPFSFNVKWSETPYTGQDTVPRDLREQLQHEKQEKGEETNSISNFDRFEIDDDMVFANAAGPSTAQEALTELFLSSSAALSTSPLNSKCLKAAMIAAFSATEALREMLTSEVVFGVSSILVDSLNVCFSTLNTEDPATWKKAFFLELRSICLDVDGDWRKEICNLIIKPLERIEDALGDVPPNNEIRSAIREEVKTSALSFVSAAAALLAAVEAFGADVATLRSLQKNDIYTRQYQAEEALSRLNTSLAKVPQIFPVAAAAATNTVSAFVGSSRLIAQAMVNTSETVREKVHLEKKYKPKTYRIPRAP